MKILVPIKRVIDYRVKVRVKPDHSGVETTNVKMSMNPFDEIAVEEALKIKEAGKADEVIVVSIGESAVQETLRTALAMGADRAIHIQADESPEPLCAAKLLKALIEKEQTELVVMGKQAIDDDNNQTGQMLAGLLNWGQGTFASKVEVQDTSVLVTREVDGGLETIELKLPAVITTDLRLNTPRFASLPNIMKAKQKPLQSITTEELNVNIANVFTTLKVQPPAERQAGIKVADVSELVRKLRDEAGVI